MYWKVGVKTCCDVVEDVECSIEDQPVGPQQMSPGELEIERILRIVDNFSIGPIQTCSLSSLQAHQILGLLEQDTEDVKMVRRQYHRLSMLVHPDKCAHYNAGAAFAALNEAVKIATGTSDSPGATDNYDSVTNFLVIDCKSSPAPILLAGADDKLRMQRNGYSHYVLLRACFNINVLDMYL